MKAIITSVIFFTLFSLQLVSQPFGEAWVSRYNGPGNNADWANALTLDNSGNVYVTGYSNGAGTSKDLLTVKYNNFGQQQWTGRYNGPVNGGDYSFAVVLDQSGNVYVTGRSDRGANLSDYTTIKYDNNGSQLWVALYDGLDHNADEAKALCVDASGNVYVTGKSFSTASGYDITTVKYNSAGVQQWVSRYNGSGNSDDWANGIGIDNSGNIYVCGQTVVVGSDFVLLKINSSGTQLWSKFYNGPLGGGDAAIALNIDASSNIYVTGYSYGGGETDFDFATLKYDGSGNELWAKRFNSLGNGADIARAMTLDINGFVYVTGSSTGSSPTADSNFASIKYDPSGNLVWSAYYSGPNFSHDVSRAITTDNSLNVYITGSSTLNGLTQDFVTIKYSQFGAEQWVYTYNGPDNNNDYTSSIAVSGTGEVYVTGRSYSLAGEYDYATIKYGLLVGITQTGNTVPDKFRLYQNYPNPFNPETKIKFDLPENANVKLDVYNALGVNVMSKDFANLSAGQYEYSLNSSEKGLSSGVYFYKLNTGKYSQTNKMVLVK